MKGIKIPFRATPRQSTPIVERVFSKKDNEILSDLINKLLDKKAIVECMPVEGQFLSDFFYLPKPDNSYRFILNLKRLNNYIVTEHFKLENHKTAINLLEKGYYMTTIDLKDAYYLLSIDEADRKYLRFYFNNKYYEFTCLPFGLNIAPFIFTKLLKPVVTLMRSAGYMSVIYLDDILLMGDSFLSCRNHFELMSKVLQYLGFIKHDKKCIDFPTQRCKWLGLIFDSSKMTLELPSEKRQEMKKLIEKFCNLKRCKIREFARFIGCMISCCVAMEFGWLYTKFFEKLKISALERNGNNFDAFMDLCPNHPDFLWWTSNILIGTKNIEYRPFALEIFTDASLSGWGAVCGTDKARGFWTSEERKHNINFLELKAAYFGLKCLATDYHDCLILMRIDNTTAICYINRMGGTQYDHLNAITREIWLWCEERNITIVASYIASKENIEADAESRVLEPETEFELAAYAFREIVQRFGQPEVDLFASRSNKKCRRFVSWKRDPESEAVDAFTIPWAHIYFYAFPPFNLILRCLRKIKRDGAEGILVVPDWPSQPWYPVFCSLLTEKPIKFNPNEKLLVSSSSKQYHIWSSVSLVAGRLSARHSQDRVSRHNQLM